MREYTGSSGLTRREPGRPKERAEDGRSVQFLGGSQEVYTSQGSVPYNKEKREVEVLVEESTSGGRIFCLFGGDLRG